MYGEWQILIKKAVVAITVVLVVSIVSLLVVMSLNPARSHMNTLGGGASFETFYSYHGRVVDRAIGRNIARANRGRLPVYLGNNVHPVSESPGDAHNEINAFFFPSGGSLQPFTFLVTIESDVSDMPVMRMVRQ